MRTLKMVYTLWKMLGESNGDEINTRSINMSIWNCQKYGAMEEYNFVPIQDGPLSNEILADVSFLEMFGIIKIQNSYLKLNGFEDIDSLIEESKSSYPSEIETIDTVIDEMKEKDLFVDEKKIIHYWKGELGELDISF
jgi:hypothetical protein